MHREKRKQTMGRKENSLRNMDADTESPTEEGVEATFYMFSPSESIAFDKKDDKKEGREYDSDEGSITCKWEDGHWVCQPYRREMITTEILKANRRGEKGHTAVLNLLKKSGVRVFVVDASKSLTVAEIMTGIRSAIRYVSKLDKRRVQFNPQVRQRCLLYKDKEGRFFNLTLADYTTAPAGAFKDYLTSFSGIQAMSILTILFRSFGCATEADIIQQDFRPAYLGVFLGLVFHEEISYSWLNTAMFVRGIPSISAYWVTTQVEVDWLRKILVFCLALSGTVTGQTQVMLTYLGITLACLVLLANLGSRAWGFLGWRPIPYGGIFEPILAYVAAVITGILVPYMGHREVEVGGKAAMESVLRSSIIVAIIFVLSDYDDFQKFMVVGSENCSQNMVNICVGIWWAASLIFSLVLVMRIPTPSLLPDEEEPLLEEDQASPVGFKVPSLPDFPIDPLLEKTGIPCISLKVEFAFGVLLATVFGGCMVYLAFTDLDEELAEKLQNETAAGVF